MFLLLQKKIVSESDHNIVGKNPAPKSYLGGHIYITYTYMLVNMT